MGKIIDCFLLEPTGRSKYWLRRYRSSSVGGDCAASGMGYHDAETFMGVILKPEDDPPSMSRDDPRWPRQCACGYAFTDDDQWQDRTREIYRRADTGDEMTLSEAPAGAMWFATWMEDHPAYCGPDGKSLVVKTPGGEWMVDSRASNCTMPTDTVHRCWCRHGVAPKITADKNGNTCGAGAGSIAQPGYHGFLVDGQLREC